MGAEDGGFDGGNVGEVCLNGFLVLKDIEGRFQVGNFVFFIATSSIGNGRVVVILIGGGGGGSIGGERFGWSGSISVGVGRDAGPFIFFLIPSSGVSFASILISWIFSLCFKGWSVGNMSVTD